MATFLQQFSGHSDATSATTTVTIPTGGIASGHGLVLSVASVTGSSGVTSISGTDTQGNTYTFQNATPITGVTTGVGMLSCNVTTALNAGDTITLTPNVSTTRMAISVFEFDVNVTADVRANADNGGVSTTSLTSGTTAATSTANELVVGAFALSSSGRIFTLGSGYSEGTKVVTTAGSGDRAVVAEYKFVTSTGTQAATGTLNSSSVYGGMVQTFSYSAGGGGGGGGVRTGKPKVWNGSAWVAHSAKVWNGSAWVAHDAKAWDGSAWTKSK